MLLAAFSDLVLRNCSRYRFKNTLRNLGMRTSAFLDFRETVREKSTAFPLPRLRIGNGNA